MKRGLLLPAMVCIAVFGSIIACQKTSDRSVSPEFNTAAAKEWYYGTFKKSAEYAGYNATAQGRKQPDWKNGNYTRIGDYEILEFPLNKEKSVVIIDESVGLSEPDKKRIAEAAISKMVFIKNRSGNIIVRETMYIPDLEYLAEHHYDISHNGFGKVDNDFSGTILVKKWNTNTVSRSIVQNGKITRWFKGEASATPASGAGRMLCTGYLVTEYARDCEVHIYSDMMVTEECGEWYTTGNEWCVADEVPGDDLPCSDPSEANEDCVCQYFGVCDDGGGGDEEDNECAMDCAEAQNMINAITTEHPDMITGETGTAGSPDANGIIRRPKNISWNFFRLNFSLGFHASYAAVYTGIIYKEDNPAVTQWKWESLQYSDYQRSGNNPPCVSTTMSVTASNPVISADRLGARATLTYSCQVNISCLNGMGAGSFQNTVNSTNFPAN